MIVWLHGGSFVYGDGTSYDARRLATTGKAVVVTVNYRLGAFGFLAHPAFDGTAHSSGNFGLEDQQAALRWVQRNARAFGGDPGNVTLMGQSAGGYSVCAQLTMPSSAGLFHRAIIHSAGCAGDDGVVTRDPVEASAKALVDELGCDDRDVATCLREADESEILAASESGHQAYRPTLGGLLPMHPRDALARGAFHKVPVLYGVNHDEESGRVAGTELAGGQPLTAADYAQQVREAFGDDADAVLAEYPVTRYGSPSEAATAVFTDANWATPTRDTQLLLAAHVPVYAYDFAEAKSPWFVGFDEPSFPLGTGHMCELAYLFDLDLFQPLTRHQQQLSRTVIGYWAAFARGGDPNHGGAPRWREFGERQHTLRLATGEPGTGPTDFAAEHHYAFWKSLAR